MTHNQYKAVYSDLPPCIRQALAEYDIDDHPSDMCIIADLKGHDPGNLVTTLIAKSMQLAPEGTKQHTIENHFAKLLQLCHTLKRSRTRDDIVADTHTHNNTPPPTQQPTNIHILEATKHYKHWTPTKYQTCEPTTQRAIELAVGQK